MRGTLTPQQVAEVLGVSKTTVLRLIRAGELKASRISPRVIKISVSDFETFLASR